MVLWIVIAVVVQGLLGLAVGSTRDREGLGFLLGLFGSGFGIVAAAMLPRSVRGQVEHEAELAAYRAGALEPATRLVILERMQQQGQLSQAELERWRSLLNAQMVRAEGQAATAVTTSRPAA